MRKTTICPKCHSKVAPSDTICMDCGADLIAAQNDVIEQAKKEARGMTAPASPAAAVANPAAAGLVLPGENAEEKRLRVFDKQEAENLRKQRPAEIMLTSIALVGSCICFAVASSILKKAGGLPGIKTLNAAEFKKLGLDVVSDPRIMFIAAACLTLAGVLCLIGEMRRLMATNSAIRAVAAGETPNVVRLSVFTQIGLLVAAFFLPPAGLVLGILFKFSKDSETRNIGSLMIWASLLCIAIVLFNWIWSIASTAMQNKLPQKTKIETSWLWSRLA